MKIGIIGLGFVGNAIKEAYWQEAKDVGLVLRDPIKGYNASYEDLAECEGVFVCVPSPMGEDGGCDTSILEGVLEELHRLDYTGVIISKCTAPPLVYENLNKTYYNLVHSPEFLTAANAVEDYVSSGMIIIGGRVRAYTEWAEQLIALGLPTVGESMNCTIKEAALAKYTINSFLATKVVFMNEIAALARSMDINYDRVMELVGMDGRLGYSHLQVPGPDGRYGFGGACFPKDTEALLKMGEGLTVLEAACKKNKEIRNQ